MNYFFDIGANVGQTFDDYLLKTHDYDGWQVVCFEPSPRHVPLLMERVSKLGDRYDISICPFAIAEHAGEALIYQKNDPRGDSLQLHLWQGQYVENADRNYKLCVKTETLPDFIQKHTLPHDNIVVKLDCEGAEYGILRSLLVNTWARERITKLMVEFHRIDAGSRDEELRLEAEFKKLGRAWEIWPY